VSVTDPAAERPGLPQRRVTVSQVVAYNTAYFRRAAGLGQQEFGALLGWSATSVSAAERSWESKRVKKFDADEIATIAAALGVPVIALFLPPEDDGTAVHYDVRPSGSEAARPFDYGAAVLAAWDDADSPVMAAFRRRLIAAGETGQVDFEAPVRASEELGHRIDDLRAFEREYRTTLQAYIEGQLLALYTPETRELAERRIREVLKRASEGEVAKVTALLLREDGTYGMLSYPPGSQDGTERDDGEQDDEGEQDS
jgi:transcriptional regulator with XRE-family HTH domain